MTPSDKREQFVQEVLTRLVAKHIEGRYADHPRAMKELDSLVPSWKELADKAAKLIYGL